MARINESRILATGAAGFIGSHLTRHLDWYERELAGDSAFEV